MVENRFLLFLFPFPSPHCSSLWERDAPYFSCGSVLPHFPSPESTSFFTYVKSSCQDLGYSAQDSNLRLWLWLNLPTSAESVLPGGSVAKGVSVLGIIDGCTPAHGMWGSPFFPCPTLYSTRETSC